MTTQTREVQFDPCDDCQGTGREVGTDEACPTCKGWGVAEEESSK